MAQEINVVARTFEVTDTQGMTEELITLAGKAAGVCYMPDDYADAGIHNVEKAIKRAHNTAKSGHHSVFDHGHISFIIKTNKIMAMLLNSVAAYTTSEKSARYTVMHPETELELTLYEKWRSIFKDLILSGYEHMTEKEADKLSIENARYLISVFTKTTMEYTISFRQAFLIVAYLERLIADCSVLTDDFSRKLLESAKELKVLFEEKLESDLLTDHKNQYFRFLEYQHSKRDVVAKKEVIGDSYTLVYEASFAALAQLQRHRTIRYSMFFKGSASYYVPEIVKEAGKTKEWLEDMERVSYCVPQGTLLRITEQGVFEDFALKCKERLCGRVQLEVAKNTEQAVEKFIAGRENLCEENQELLASMTKISKEDGRMEPCARCLFSDFTCREGCSFGPVNALKRNI
ncbi:FAD-dependent thymidylate synthase [Lachnospiraceae bacterium OttesenSCG-928-D06]|nr:FAD-dependent thymidylate synthase [Lachnospiraceae bacterium OttesenSCG-928-D06]